MPRFQWRVLPQGMANSPTLCQRFVAKIVDPFRLQFPSLYIIHYMDDILLGGPTPEITIQASCQLIEALEHQGLQVAPDKVQFCPPQFFLGFELFPQKIVTQKLRLR